MRLEEKTKKRIELNKEIENKKNKNKCCDY